MIARLKDLINLDKILNKDQAKELENILEEDIERFVEITTSAMADVGETFKLMKEDDKNEKVDNLEAVKERADKLADMLYEMEILRYKKILKIYEFGKKYRLDRVLIKVIADQFKE